MKTANRPRSSRGQAAAKSGQAGRADQLAQLVWPRQSPFWRGGAFSFFGRVNTLMGYSTAWDEAAWYPPTCR